MIDRKFIGYEMQAHSVPIEKGQLRFFAKATGQKDPIYSDEAAAISAGHKSLPAPPTFLFSLDLLQEEPFILFKILGVDLNRILHGEQSFRYYKPIYAGDVIKLQSRISDIYEKKNGALEFIVQDYKAMNQDNEHVADMTRVIVVRNS